MSNFTRVLGALLLAGLCSNSNAQESKLSVSAEAKVVFAAGAAAQKQAETTNNVDVRRAAQNEAESIYTKALQGKVEPGLALNNLAVLAMGKGDDAAAKRYFEDAIASNDGRKAFYALNYSKFLQGRDKTAAVQAARMAVEAAPESMVANQQLGAALWQANPEQMLPLANDLVAKGHTDLATKFALQCLQSQRRPAVERRAWMILLASRLANEYSVSTSARESLAKDLATLDADPEIGKASQQLRAVIFEAPKNRTAIDWWAGQYEKTAPNGKTGRTAMREVLVAAGEYQAQRDIKLAEQYLTSAIELGEQGPDPDAFLRLVEIYATQNTMDSLAKLMDRYQWELFTEKSSAYGRGDWPLIYRMHVALGMTYAHLKVWTSTSEYQNAIFQLTHAMQAADQLNRRAQQQGKPERIALPPVAVKMLAEGYAAMGQLDRAAKVRVDAAGTLKSIGHSQDSDEVVQSIAANDVQKLDAASKAKYEQLRGDVGVAR